MVSWTCSTQNSITIGISGFVVTGLNIALNSNVGTWGAGYNYYQSGYAELKGSVANGTAICGSVCVIIGAGSSHNTIGIATVYGSTGNTGVGDVNTSMSVVRVA